MNTPFKAAGIAALILGLLPAAAGAATVSYEGDALVVRAQPGEANSVLLQDGYPDATKLRIEDRVTLATSADACHRIDDYTLDCAVPARVRVELGDGNDRVGSYNTLSHDVAYELLGGDGDDVLDGYADAPLRESIDGGPGKDALNGFGGDDRLVGGPQNDTLQGGGGSDVLLGEDGDDELRGDHQAAPAADVVDGGPGTDRLVDYTEYGVDTNPPADVSLDGVANDGRSGENDDVRSIERHIAYVSGTHVLTDGAEEWQVWANLDGGASRVEARGGDDKVTGADSSETIDGGAGNDRIEGGKGHDTLTGGPGVDTIFGDETTSSCKPDYPESCVRYGNDVIDARDGQADQVDCGAGTDRVTADAADVVAANCETVERGGAGGPGTGGSGAGGPGTGGPGLQDGPGYATTGARATLAPRQKLRTVLRKGLVVRLTGVKANRATLVARSGRRVVARGTAAVVSGRATVRLRFTKAGRRALARKRTVKLRLSGAGVRANVTVAR